MTVGSCWVGSCAELCWIFGLDLMMDWVGFLCWAFGSHCHWILLVLLVTEIEWRLYGKCKVVELVALCKWILIFSKTCLFYFKNCIDFDAYLTFINKTLSSRHVGLWFEEREKFKWRESGQWQARCNNCQRACLGYCKYFSPRYTCRSEVDTRLFSKSKPNNKKHKCVLSTKPNGFWVSYLNFLP